MTMPLNIDWQQILLHLMNFVILAGGLYWLLYSPVQKFMEKRFAHYEEMDQQAQAKLRHAQELEESYQACLDGAEEEIRQQKARAAEEILHSTEEELSRARAQGEALVEKAKQMAEQERRKQVAEAQKEILQIAVDATEKLLKPSSSDTLDAFLDSVKEG